MGLLVLTQDGVWRQIIGEDSEVDKEYRCAWSTRHRARRYHGTLARPRRCRKTTSVTPVSTNAGGVSQRVLERLRHGLSLDGEPLKARQGGLANPEQLRLCSTDALGKRQIRRTCASWWGSRWWGSAHPHWEA